MVSSSPNHTTRATFYGGAGGNLSSSARVSKSSCLHKPSIRHVFCYAEVTLSFLRLKSWYRMQLVSTGSCSQSSRARDRSWAILHRVFCCFTFLCLLCLGCRLNTDGTSTGDVRLSSISRRGQRYLTSISRGRSVNCILILLVFGFKALPERLATRIFRLWERYASLWRFTDRCYGTVSISAWHDAKCLFTSSETTENKMWRKQNGFAGHFRGPRKSVTLSGTRTLHNNCFMALSVLQTFLIYTMWAYCRQWVILVVSCITAIILTYWTQNLGLRHVLSCQVSIASFRRSV